MNPSRFNKKSRERLLFTAAALVIIVILSVLFWVIPQITKGTTSGASPEKAVPAFWVLIALHVTILAVLINNIHISRRGGRLRKIGLIIPGIILVLFSMLMIEVASIYLERLHVMLRVAIVLFISAFCDLIAGIITVMLPTRITDNQQNYNHHT